MKFIKQMWCAIGRLSRAPHIYESAGAAQMAAETKAYQVVVLDKMTYDEMVAVIKELSEENADGRSYGLEHRVNDILKEHA